MKTHRRLAEGSVLFLQVTVPSTHCLIALGVFLRFMFEFYIPWFVPSWQGLCPKF